MTYIHDRSHSYLGQVACSHTDGGYLRNVHFELRIKQGPIMQEEKKKIGVVQGAQAYHWFTFTLTGQPMSPMVQGTSSLTHLEMPLRLLAAQCVIRLSFD